MTRPRSTSAAARLWLGALVVSVVAACGDLGGPRLTPDAVLVGQVTTTPLRITGLVPSRFLEATDGSLGLVDDYRVTIGGQRATVVSADGDGVTVSLDAELEPGMYGMQVVARKEQWQTADALRVFSDDELHDGGLADGGVSNGPDSGADAGVDAPASVSTVYATTRSDLYTFDPLAGTVTLVGRLGCVSLLTVVHDVAVSRDGRVLIVAGDVLYTVDPMTATCASIGAIVGATGIYGLAFTGPVGAEQLVGTTGLSPGKLFTIDASTAVATQMGSFAGGYLGRDVTWIDGNHVASLVTGTTYVIARVPSASVIGGTTSLYNGLAHVGGKLYGFSGDGAIAQLDTTNAAVLDTTSTGLFWTGAGAAPP